MDFTKSPSSHEQALEVEDLRGLFQPECLVTLQASSQHVADTHAPEESVMLSRLRTKYGRFSGARFHGAVGGVSAGAVSTVNPSQVSQQRKVSSRGTGGGVSGMLHSLLQRFFLFWTGDRV